MSRKQRTPPRRPSPDAELLGFCKLFDEQTAIIDAYSRGVIRDRVMLDAALSAQPQLAARIQNMRPVTPASTYGG